MKPGKAWRQRIPTISRPTGHIRRTRHRRRSWLRLIISLLCTLAFLDFLATVYIHASSLCTRPPAAPEWEDVDVKERERIFIASLYWEDAPLLRSHGTPAILDLVRQFDAENVYVSIIESGSSDDTRSALSELDVELGNLGVERFIQRINSSREDELNRIPGKNEEGWVWTGRERKEMRLIPYLASLRNQAMEQLRELGEREIGRRWFDKVLWLDDVIFTSDDVLTLLKTRNGDYSAVCSLDISHPPSHHDTFALRDIDGHPTITTTWPYFHSATSRQALITSEPVPVQSCWNGMVILNSEPFYHDPPLKFRGVQDSLATHHVEASECCLIHADNKMSKQKGVWINPNVKVSYDPSSDQVMRGENAIWPGRLARVWRLWGGRWARVLGGLEWRKQLDLVKRRIEEWQDEKPGSGEVHVEPGAHCVVNEMRVLADNGWEQV